MPEIIWSTCLIFTKEETEFYRLRLLKVTSLVGDCLALIIQNSHVLGGLVVFFSSLFWLFCFNCTASAKKKANCNDQTNYLYFLSFLNPHHCVTLCISLLSPLTVWAMGPLLILSPPKYVSLRIPPNLHPVQPSHSSHRLLSSVSLPQLFLILPTLYLNQCIPPLPPS